VPKPRAVVISNPVASRVTPAVERRAVTALDPFAAIDLVRTERPLHAGELADEAIAGGADAVLVLAGDGTLNEVLNAVGDRVPVGVLPGGGTSVLARCLGLPRRLEAAATQTGAALAAGRSRHVSLGILNGRRFAFAAGIGLDAEVVRRVDAYGRPGGRRRGDGTFVLELLKLVLQDRYREPRATLRAEGRSERCALVIAANMHPWSYFGPLPLRAAPRAQAEAGIDILAPARLGRREAPRAARYLLLDGAPAYREIPGFAYFHDLSDARVVCDEPLPAEVDGDDIGDVVEAVLGVDRRGARFLV
jgi:diacylglycerol kinase family enzyme